MKAPAFDYARPTSLAEALGLLREHGDEAKIIAGGQSLVPALNLRLLAPKLLVDIGGLSKLRGIAVANGRVRIGALTRHAELMRSRDIAAHLQLIAQAIPHVAHPAVRNRGTFGGSLAHADPASELPACAVALAGEMVMASAAGERRIAAERFFTGIYETVLRSDEVLVAFETAVPPAQQRCAFLELARRHGDYAIAGIAAVGEWAGDGLSELRLVFFGVGSRPTLARQAAAALVGRPLTDSALSEAQRALADDLDPQSDIQASAATRLHLAGVLLRRAVAQLGSGDNRCERRSA